MKRFDFYFEQLVGESDMDQLQSNIEESIWRLMTDQAYFGVTTGYSVVQHSPVPNLTVDVGGPGIAYDQLGRRVYMSGSVALNMSIDSNGSPTTVVTVGNEKWLSVFVQFTRTQSDQRFDGNSLPVLYVNEEGYQFIVVQGAEASIGVATRPALRSDAVLIADVLIGQGTTQILNAAIESADTNAKPNSRFQYAFNLTASSPAKVRIGRVPAALQYVLDQLNNHIAGVTGVHPGTSISNDIVPESLAWVNLLAGANMSEAIGGMTQDLRDEGSNLIDTDIYHITGISGAAPLNSFFGSTLQSALNEIAQKFTHQEQIVEDHATIYQTTSSGADYRALYRRPSTNNHGIRVYTHDSYGWCFTINQFWDIGSASWKSSDTTVGREAFRVGNLKSNVDGGGTQQGSVFGIVAQHPGTSPSGYVDDQFFDVSHTGGFIFSVKSPQYSGNLIRLGSGASSTDTIGFNFDVTPGGAGWRRYDCGMAGAAPDITADSWYIGVQYPGDFGSLPTTFGWVTDDDMNVTDIDIASAGRTACLFVLDRAVGASFHVGKAVMAP